MSALVPTIQETIVEAAEWLKRARDWDGPSVGAEAAQMRLAMSYAEAVLVMVAACMKDGDQP